MADFIKVFEAATTTEKRVRLQLMKTKGARYEKAMLKATPALESE
jgi:hypothetical protein